MGTICAKKEKPPNGGKREMNGAVKKAISSIVVVLMVFFSTSCSTDSHVETKEPESSSIVVEPEESSFPEEMKETEFSEPNEYDELQSIFIKISADTTIEELDSIISENNLFYTSQEYNKSDGGKSLKYKIAYTEGSAAQKYADSGDYLEVAFDRSADNCLMYAHYVNESSVGYSALLYNYGTWYDLRENQPGNYTGYYISDSFGNNEGITITYSNGNGTNTNYFPFESGEDVINAVIDNTRQK